MICQNQNLHRAGAKELFTSRTEYLIFFKKFSNSLAVVLTQLKGEGERKEGR